LNQNLTGSETGSNIILVQFHARLHCILCLVEIIQIHFIQHYNESGTFHIYF